MSNRNPNPYFGVDWHKTCRLTGCTHVHCTTNAVFSALIDQGLDFATFANYYPSAPYFPLHSICENTFKLGQRSYVKNGVYHREPVDFSSFSGISQPGKPIFQNIPVGLLEAPCAEHHWFSDRNVHVHIASPGSWLASGHFDLKHAFGVEKAGYQLGFPVPWRTGFKAIFDELMIPDGGGIVINHPLWSHLSVDAINEMLDFDDRVLGIEIFNHNAANYFADSGETAWDEVLRTGRQCFGFCVQDHLLGDGLPWRGKIVLLARERTAEAGLRAMRQGCFYGAIKGDVKFEYIDFDGRILRAACDRPVSFQLISSLGWVAGGSGTEFRYEVEDNARSKHRFLRLAASYGVRDDKLFSQPFIL